MWFGTPDGLCRYDGRILTAYKYRPANKKETANNFVRGKIHEDEGGNIWYSNETGIHKWDALKQEVFPEISFTRDAHRNMQFMGIQLDRNGYLWMMALPTGLARYNTKNQKLDFFPLQLPGLNFSAGFGFATVDYSDDIWFRVNSASEHVMKFTKKTATYTRHFTDNAPHALFFDHEKSMLFFFDKIVFKYYDARKEVVVPKMVNGKKVDFFFL